MKYLVNVLIACIAAYLIVAFVWLDLNPSNWSFDGRVSAIFLSLVSSYFAVVFTLIFKD